MENQQLHDAQLAIDAEYEAAARVEWLADHLEEYLIESDYDSIDEYLVDAGVNGIEHSNIDEWIENTEDHKEAASEFLEGVNVERNASVLMRGYIDFVLEGWMGL